MDHRYLSLLGLFCYAILINGCWSQNDSDSPPQTTANPTVSTPQTTANPTVSAPTISQQPIGVNVEVGQRANFFVSAQGESVKYQWLRNGVQIEGANSSDYSIESSQFTDAGVKFSVLVSNEGGEVLSDSALLTVSQRLADREPKGYLNVGEIVLAELDPTLSGAAEEDISVINGPNIEMKLGTDGVLRYLSPTEQYSDTITTIAIKSQFGDGQYILALPWISRIGPSMSPIQEGSDDETPVSELTVTGVDDYGTVNNNLSSLVYTLKSPQVISAEDCYIHLSTLDGNIDVTPWFDIDGNVGKLTLKSGSINNFISAVQNASEATLTFSLSTKGLNETYGFEHSLQYRSGTVNVTIVSPSSQPVISLLDEKFIVSGFNTGIRLLATVGPDGAFKVDNLPADTYSVEQVMLELGTPLIGFVTLPASDASSTLQIIQEETGGSVAAKLGVNSLSHVGSRAMVTDPGNSTPAPSRPISAPKITMHKTGDAYSVAATAGDAGVLSVEKINYTVPVGTSEISIDVSVYTAEFPTYTSQQSIYNDVWQFNIGVLGQATFAQMGKVNQTHSTAGTVNFKRCIKLPTPSTSELTIFGTLGAQNVSDSALPTSVSLSINLNCSSLAISSFTGLATSASDIQLIYPRIKATVYNGNVNGQYLSIPISEKLPSMLGIPATLTFEPINAVPTNLELRLRTASGEVSLGTNYLTQAKVSAGKITFPSLLLNNIAHTPTTNKVALIALLKATVDGTELVTEPKEMAVNEGKEIYSIFTPIYLSSDVSGYNINNRFAKFDAAVDKGKGGDSWGTLSMLTWLLETGYKYNDISAAMVGQKFSVKTKKYRSILDHSGHNDGQQVDVRYYDDKGGFTENLGGDNNGAGIYNLAENAMNEFNKNSIPHPNLDMLVSWISKNRSGIALECQDLATRRIYIGNKFIALLLLNGKFPIEKIVLDKEGKPILDKNGNVVKEYLTGKDIPFVGPWNVGACVTPQDSHLDHWHISKFRP